MPSMYFNYIQTNIPHIPEILAIASDKGLCDIIFNFQENFIIKQSHFIKHHSKIFIQLKQEFDLYASGELKEFTVPLDIQGTLYQKKIWHILQKIPCGTTQSYKDIALQAGSAPRAIGGANRKNRLPIIIPCHRVINHNGRIGGYFGATITSNPSVVNLKQILLDCEKHYYIKSTY